MGGGDGLYVYDGSLRKLANGSVVELSCQHGVAAALRAKGSWFVYLDGQLFQVEGRPFNLERSPDGMRLAFSIQSTEQVGIVSNGLVTVRGYLGGWVDGRVVVYRDSEVCLVPP